METIKTPAAVVNSTVMPVTASQREVRLRVLGRMSHNGSKLDGPHAVDGSQLEVGVEVRSITPRLFRGELIRPPPPPRSPDARSSVHGSSRTAQS